MHWPGEIAQILNAMVGQMPTRIEIGEHDSLSIGIGDLAPPRPRHKREYRKWEIGSYHWNWRLVIDGEVATLPELPYEVVRAENYLLGQFEFGPVVWIGSAGTFDIRVQFERIGVEFLQFSMNDEYFHAFCPDSQYVEAKPGSACFPGETNCKVGGSASDYPSGSASCRRRTPTFPGQ